MKVFAFRNEKGYLDGPRRDPRRGLLETFAYARPWTALIVACDTSRYLRAAQHNPQGDWWKQFAGNRKWDRPVDKEFRAEKRDRLARPTAFEWDALRALAVDLVLTTLAHPGAGESELHRRRTRRSPNNGRPRSITNALMEEIFGDPTIRILRWQSDRDGSWHWDPPLGKLLKGFVGRKGNPVTEQSFLRALDCGAPGGGFWRDKIVVYPSACWELIPDAEIEAQWDALMSSGLPYEQLVQEADRLRRQSKYRKTPEWNEWAKQMEYLKECEAVRRRAEAGNKKRATWARKRLDAER
jgi:hypothetical protein